MRAQIIDLDTALSEIRQACEETGHGSITRSPFFWVVGAGISYPPVPLAGQIIDHCQELARKYNRTTAPQDQQTLDVYSHWFSRAYPHPRQRQRYLRSLIERQPLSSASLRLAHLLSSRKLTHLVVTTNFDDFIARALRLFGEEPVVCDHPSTVGRIDTERNDIQIVHAHGSYLFYDCANLYGEVTGRAQTNDETSFTMVGLLDNLLWTRSPLVVGYSGWEGDVITSALRRRISNSLAQSIYWFCYKRSDVDRLPRFLLDASDVRLIVPPKPTSLQAEVTQTRGGQSTEEQRTSASPDEPVCTAREVFEQLNRALETGTPALFKDPLEYFASNLEAALPGDDGPTSEGDPYAFRELIARIRRMVKPSGVSQQAQNMTQLLKGLRSAMRESRYRPAVDTLAKLIPTQLAQLQQDERLEVLNAAAIAGTALLEKPEAKPLAATLAEILCVDGKIEMEVGTLPANTALVFAARTGQYAFETTIDGQSYGAFTYNLSAVIKERSADRNSDGKISVYEAVVTTGARLITNHVQQTPVVVGNAERLFLFSASPTTATNRARGRLLAILIGVGKYQQPGIDLPGPAHDIHLLQQLLADRSLLLLNQVLCRPLVDEKATLAKVQAVLKWAHKEARADDVVLFFFSGHASTYTRHAGTKPAKKQSAPTLYLHDFDGKEAGQFILRDLIEQLSKSKARYNIMLDSG